jgi:TRAP-type C4-dicarboxylate transport system substrate-binding protein
MIHVEFRKMASELAEKTKGRLKLTFFPASQLGPPPRSYDLVRTGVADMSYVIPGLTPGRFPLSQMAELPGVSATGYATSMAMMDLYEEYLEKEHPGVKLIGFMNTPPAPLMMTKVEVRSLADLRNKRIRHPGPIHSATLSALGAVPVAIQPLDIHESMARGTVDGALVGYSGAGSFRLGEIVKFVTEVNLGGINFITVMNPASYDNLPPDIRKLMDAYMGKAGARIWARVFDHGEAVERKVLEKQGPKFVEMGAKEQAEFAAAATNVHETTIADYEKKGLPARAYFQRLKAGIAQYSK